MAMGTSAYRLDAFPAYEPAPRAQQRRADVRAMRTNGPDQAASQTPLIVTAARLAIVALVVIAILGLVRIALTSATVATLIESDSLSAQIEEARTTGTSLEMQQSVLSSPSNIKSAIKRLGMTAPGEAEVITLEPDVVAVDAQGTLSLSDSVKNVVRAQE